MAERGVISDGPFSHRVAARRGEMRLPVVVAVIVAAVLHTALPSDLLVEPRWVIPAVEALLLVALATLNPNRLTLETRWSRVAGLVLAAIVILTNTVSLVSLLDRLISSPPSDGRALLLAALQVWLTNMIAFALVYWELDRGGAVARLPTSDVAPRRTDFLFPQDDPAVAAKALGSGEILWLPMFTDYLYVSVTNSVAFSPTDTMPLTTRAKALMAAQAMAAMVTSLLVVARAVGILR